MIFEHYVGDRCGAHAFSPDGVRWSVTNVSTWYTLHVEIDGRPQTLRKRERPQVVWNVTSGRGLLFNGACLPDAGCFNINADIGM